MPGWSRATLTHNDVVAPGLHRITLDVSTEVARGFQAPGQYHRVRVANGKDSVFAIASPPGQARFEYLVRANQGVAGALTRLAVGAEVEVSHPDGPGFPLEQAKGRTLLVIGTGTGYAPLRSVLHHVRERRAEFGRVHGLYGAHEPAQLAWHEEFSALSEAGIHVTPTVSHPAHGWGGAVGRVQQLVAKLPTEGAIAFLCGQMEMIAEVTQLLATHGVPNERVFLNYPTG